MSINVDVNLEGLNFKELLKEIEYRNVGGDNCRKEIVFLHELQERIGSGLENQIHPNKVIVRSGEAGVFFGELAERNGTEVKMKDVRKIFYWAGAAAIEQLAMEGTTKPENCKFTVVVPEMEIMGVIQVITCTNKAVANIEAVKEWKV